MLPGDFLSAPITFRAALRYIQDSSRHFAVMESMTKLSAYLNKFLTVSNTLYPLCDLSKSKYPCVNSIQECLEGGVLCKYSSSQGHRLRHYRCRLRVGVDTQGLGAASSSSSLDEAALGRRRYLERLG